MIKNEPLFQNSPAIISGCNVKRTTNQSIPKQTWTKIQLDTKIYDIQDEFDFITNFRFTAKNAGIYMVIGQLNVNATDGEVYGMGLSKNGGINDIENDLAPGATIGIAWQGSGFFQLAVDDYIELYVWHNHGSALDFTGKLYIGKIG